MLGSNLLGGLASGGFGFLGAKDTNRANKAIANSRNLMEVREAEKARGFSKEEAALNRKFQDAQVGRQLGFQERMSSTAVQRRMEDMRKAGINPILAGKYEAGSPGGAAASGAMASTAKANAHGYEAKNEIGAAMDRLSTALDLKTKEENIKNIQANTLSTTTKTNTLEPLSLLMEWISTFIKDADPTAKSMYEGAKVSIPKLIDKIQPTPLLPPPNYYKRKPLKGER